MSMTNRSNYLLKPEAHLIARGEHILHPVFVAAEGEIRLAVQMTEYGEVDLVLFKQLRKQRFAVF